MWDRWSEGYQRRHGPGLDGDAAAAWGIWRRRESDLGLLGEVAGAVVLDLGCGAGAWARALRARGALVVGLDNSGEQVHLAARLGRGEGLGFVQATAGEVPLRDGSVDVIISDYGAMTWSDPSVTVPEAARVLRRGGRLVFAVASPIFLALCEEGSGVPTERLARGYFGPRTRVVASEGLDYVPTYEQWFAMFRNAGLAVTDVLESRPSADASTTFSDRPTDLARRVPLENIWSVTKTAP